MVAVPEIIACFGGPFDGYEVAVPAGDLPAPEYRLTMRTPPTFPVLAAVLLDTPPVRPTHIRATYALADRNGTAIYRYVGLEVT